jgi:cytochrome P450
MSNVPETPEVHVEIPVVEIPVVDFNYVTDSALRADPWGRWDQLREEHRWFRVDDGPDPIWILTQYDDIHEAFQRYDLFSNATVEPYNPVGLHRFIPAELDPPEHSRYRQIVLPFFSQVKAQEMTPVIRSWCSEVIEGFEGDRRCDFLNQFARKFPTYIFLDFMGYPLDRAETLIGWANDYIRSASPDQADKHRAAMESIKGFLAEMIEDRRRQPRDDVVTHLTKAEIDGRPLLDSELEQFLLVLYLGGLDTVAGQLGCIFHYLATEPDRRRQIVADPSMIPDAVEELLRYFSILSTGRVVTRDVDFHGCPMKQGDRMLLSVLPANRDESQFEHADEVRFDRAPNRHMAFAVGPHRCLGAHLARVELAVAVEEWHRRIPDYRLAPGVKPTLHAGHVVGFDELHLVWS